MEMSLDTYLTRGDTPTQRAFADLVGIEESALSRIRRGLRVPTLAQALAIEVATGGSVAPRSFLAPEAFAELQRRALAPVAGSRVRVVRNGPHAGLVGTVAEVRADTLRIHLGDFTTDIAADDVITMRAR